LGVNETREHIVRLADGLIREKGFNAFSYADIASVLEIRKAAIHYHFPTKSILGQAVMYEEILRLDGYRYRNSGLSGEIQFRRLVETFYHNAQRYSLCLMGALTPEFATFDAGMREMVRKLSGSIREWVGECLAEARAAGSLRFEGSAEDRAGLVVSVLLASLLMGRVEGVERFRRMVDQLLEDLGVGWRTGDLSTDDGKGGWRGSYT
jgi:AcrR family transcriptional regulator